MEKYQILLVDDEELALRGIERGVGWEKLGISKVFKTHGKDTAIRMLETYQIDIVFTDIEMPNGTGLELIQWVKENQPQVICIFYTCHAEFSYAQEAVRLGVLDYLLKPIPYRELELILEKSLKVIEERRKNKKVADILNEIPAEADSAIDKIKKYIMENISMNIQRDDLVKNFYINPDYLSKLFKKEEGITISQYIAEKRYSLAKQLLKNTNLSISDVGQRVGMLDTSYFIKTFKKWEGITPQQYRNEQNK